MLIKDRVYGEFEVTEEVLIELINSKPVQRLKGISQHGTSRLSLYPEPVSRYEHSVGVMILLRLLSASLEEQIAGLLHDVPHTAFSHVIDWVYKSKEQDFHEKFHEKVVMNSEIPQILQKFGFDINRILNEHNFPLLERPSPDLCADRIDYTLRDYSLVMNSNSRVLEMFKAMVVKDNEIIFSDKKQAKNFTDINLWMGQSWWANIVDVARYQIFANAIQIALNEDILIESDLFNDDSFVYDKLVNSSNEKIMAELNLLNQDFECVHDPDNYMFHSFAKFRYVNPKVLTENVIKRVSELFPEMKNIFEEEKVKVEAGYYIKVIKNQTP